MNPFSGGGGVGGGALICSFAGFLGVNAFIMANFKLLM